MGQDAMPVGLAAPFSPSLPPRERVFLRGLYTDVEARLGRVDSGIDALRRRVRDFDGVLDGQIRRCESAEDRVRSLRDDFSRMDREISEMSAELDSTLELAENAAGEENGDNYGEEFQEYDSTYNCQIKGAQSSKANSSRTYTDILPLNSELRNNNERTMETVQHHSLTNMTTARESMTGRKTPPTPTDQSTQEDSSLNRSGQAMHDHIPNSSYLSGEQRGDSKDTRQGVDYHSRQTGNRPQPRDGDHTGISIQQDNNAVSIGVVCNVHEPTANGRALPKTAFDAQTAGNDTGDLSRAEKQLVGMAREMNEFKKSFSLGRSKSTPGGCLAVPSISSHESGAATTVQCTQSDRGVTVTRTAEEDESEMHNPTRQSPESVANERYAQFDRFVEDIIKRHSCYRFENVELNKEDSMETGDGTKGRGEFAENKELNHSAKDHEGQSMTQGNHTSPTEDVAGSRRDAMTPQSASMEAGPPDLTSSTMNAEGYMTCDESTSSCVSDACQHGLSCGCLASDLASQSPDAHDDETCYTGAAASSPERSCSWLLAEHSLSEEVETAHCSCCLHDLLATYVHRFLELLHSRVTKEVRKRSKAKHRGGSDLRRRASDGDIARARDAVFGRLGLTSPMLEVLLGFDQHCQRCRQRRCVRIDPAYVTDDEMHRLLVTIGMSWHAMNNHQHETDLAFRIAIATVHGHMHHSD